MSIDLINDLLILSLALFFVSLFYRFFFGFLLVWKTEKHHKYCEERKNNKGGDPLVSQKIMFGNAWIKEYKDYTYKAIYSTVLCFCIFIALLIYKHL